MAPSPVSVTVRETASVEPPAAFPVAVGVELPLIFTGFGPLPAVTAVRDQTGPWDRVGVSRRPVLSDGSVVHERITDHQPPSFFGYEVSGFTGLLGWAVHGARGEWRLAPGAGGGTAIEWTYAFRPRRFRRAPVRLAVAPLWRAYMRRALAATVREMHARAGRAPAGR
ncbi:SRPBCC family protein [Streptomyces sp. TRM 70361]|uniref:SRPBCC family protein n=1 Tax=Streptomyces sp. TRM 70361 TaxID=3116553 RepID=UPI002E7ADCD9|nr:SRPBCC family protein [Streptomyces sp. TRM 70361]MEE1940188.1 SRPBCC family protein [Streptomyces sp. TRM 70361]